MDAEGLMWHLRMCIHHVREAEALRHAQTDVIEAKQTDLSSYSPCETLRLIMVRH